MRPTKTTPVAAVASDNALPWTWTLSSIAPNEFTRLLWTTGIGTPWTASDWEPAAIGTNGAISYYAGNQVFAKAEVIQTNNIGL